MEINYQISQRNKSYVGLKIANLGQLTRDILRAIDA